MDSYIDIRVRPDPEFSMPMLMNALVSKLHRALVAINADDIGISFPGYTMAPKSLGDKVRLHGRESRLCELMDTSWLRGMSDHVICGSPEPVPEGVVHRVFRRKQFKSNAERLRRRRMKRKGESYEQAAEAIPGAVEQRTQLPFVTLSSKSTGETFKIFIEQGEATENSQEGVFSSYGLSQGATVPWF